MRYPDGFQDCITERRLGKDKWEVLRIEFEYESRSFIRHVHDINGADVFGHEKKPSKLSAYLQFCQNKRLEHFPRSRR